MLSTRQHLYRPEINISFPKNMLQFSLFSLKRQIKHYQKWSLLHVKIQNPTHSSTNLIMSLLLWADFDMGLETHPINFHLVQNLGQMNLIPSLMHRQKVGVARTHPQDRSQSQKSSVTVSAGIQDEGHSTSPSSSSSPFPSFTLNISLTFSISLWTAVPH